MAAFRSQSRFGKEDYSLDRILFAKYKYYRLADSTSLAEHLASRLSPRLAQTQAALLYTY